MRVGRPLVGRQTSDDKGRTNLTSKGNRCLIDPNDKVMNLPHTKEVGDPQGAGERPQRGKRDGAPTRRIRR